VRLTHEEKEVERLLKKGPAAAGLKENRSNRQLRFRVL